MATTVAVSPASTAAGPDRDTLQPPGGGAAAAALGEAVASGGALGAVEVVDVVASGTVEVVDVGASVEGAEVAASVEGAEVVDAGAAAAGVSFVDVAAPSVAGVDVEGAGDEEGSGTGDEEGSGDGVGADDAAEAGEELSAVAAAEGAEAEGSGGDGEAEGSGPVGAAAGEGEASGVGALAVGPGSGALASAASVGEASEGAGAGGELVSTTGGSSLLEAEVRGARPIIEYLAPGAGAVEDEAVDGVLDEEGGVVDAGASVAVEDGSPDTAVCSAGSVAGTGGGGCCVPGSVVSCPDGMADRRLPSAPR